MADDSDLKEILKGLDPELRTVLKYFIRYRSVGELIAIRELRGLYRIEDPAKCIGKLVDLGLIERGMGCYNISKRVLRHLSSENGRR